MREGDAAESELRFSAYVEGLPKALRHRDREAPFRDYCMGLMGTEERKSVEPLAAVTASDASVRATSVAAAFRGAVGWSDAAVLAEVRADVLPAIERDGPIEAWIIDDTSFPKQGRHSVGVARQYCGQLGKQDNCQAAVTLSIANHHASLPVGYRLYLPQEWAEDAPRRKERSSPTISSSRPNQRLRSACSSRPWRTRHPAGFVLMDAGYGVDTAFCEAVTALGLLYVMGIEPTTSVWAPGVGPLPQPSRGAAKAPVPCCACGATASTNLSRSRSWRSTCPKQAWRTIAWREGTNDVLKGRFARVRVHAAHRDNLRSELRPEEWLLIEWPESEKEPTKYWPSTLPADITFDQLVDAIKLRWRIERDYQELKQEVGLGHYEGRGWRGFHHHATLCIAAYGFLISERETIPPSGHPRAGRFQTSAVSRRPVPEDPPLRPERHVPNSIATLRRRIAVALADALPRCPCCLRLRL